MPRNSAGSPGSDASSGTTAVPEPEIMRSAHLANILTLALVEMIEEAAKRYEAAGLGRRMAPELAAMRGTVREIRSWHSLPAIDWRSGLPVGDPADTASSNGTEPESVEAGSPS